MFKSIDCEIDLDGSRAHNRDICVRPGKNRTGKINNRMKSLLIVACRRRDCSSKQKTK